MVIDVQIRIQMLRFYFIIYALPPKSHDPQIAHEIYSRPKYEQISFYGLWL